VLLIALAGVFGLTQFKEVEGCDWLDQKSSKDALYSGPVDREYAQPARCECWWMLSGFRWLDRNGLAALPPLSCCFRAFGFAVWDVMDFSVGRWSVHWCRLMVVQQALSRRHRSGANLGVQRTTPHRYCAPHCDFGPALIFGLLCHSR
jgi:hypothetical protein